MSSIRAYTHVLSYVHAYAHTYIHARLQMCTHVCVGVYVYVYVHIYIAAPAAATTFVAAFTSCCCYCRKLPAAAMCTSLSLSVSPSQNVSVSVRLSVSARLSLFISLSFSADPVGRQQAHEIRLLEVDHVSISPTGAQQCADTPHHPTETPQDRNKQTRMTSQRASQHIGRKSPEPRSRPAITATFAPKTSEIGSRTPNVVISLQGSADYGFGSLKRVPATATTTKVHIPNP